MEPVIPAAGEKSAVKPHSRYRLLEEWNSYRQRVLPAQAPTVQVKECRRAFYAGAQALLHAITRDLSEGSEALERDERMLIDVNAELRAFVEDVKAGRA